MSRDGARFAIQPWDGNLSVESYLQITRLTRLPRGHPSTIEIVSDWRLQKTGIIQ
jgi:hypothetical protein